MAGENKGFKVLMIVVNVLIWGYAAIEVVPLLLGDSSSGDTVVAVNEQLTESRRPEAASESAPPGIVQQQNPGGDWIRIQNPVKFFLEAQDPFRPVLVPAEKNTSTGTSVSSRSGQRIPGYTIPGASALNQPVTTSYRLSGLMEIGGNVVALLTAGAGAGAEAVQVKQGQELPDGSRVREVSFKNNYVIIVKEGHVFKLIDYSPWVLLLERP